MSSLLLNTLFHNNNSSPGMESEFSNDSSARGSPPSSSSATSVSADSFLSSGIDNSPFASFRPHPVSSMSPSSSTAGPDLASLFPGMDINVNNLQIGQQDPRRSAAETSIATPPGATSSSSSAAFAQALSYPLDPADNGAGRFIQGAGHDLSDPLAFLDQPSIIHSQSHLHHHQHQAFHHQHPHQQQQHHAHVPSYQRHRAFTTSAASDPAAILSSIHRPSSATATSSSATMFDPLDLNSYAMAGVPGPAPGYGISGVEEVAGGPAIDSPTTAHQQHLQQQGHPSPMNSHAASGSPPSLSHRDSLSSNSSENTEVGAKESTPAALADGASAGGVAAAGDDAPAPPVVKAGRKLPKPVTDFLRKWLLEHADHPYPNEQEKKMLCEKTGLTMHQLSNWMINARRRILVPASKVIQTIGSSPYSMGQRRSTSALAAAHAYRVVDPSSTAGPSGSASGPAPSHYIPHLLPEQLAAGVQRSQRGLAPSSASGGVVVGSSPAGLQQQQLQHQQQAQAQVSGAAFPGRGLQRSGTFPPPVSRDAGFYSSSSPSASSATGSTSSSASPSIPAHPAVPIPPRLLPSHIMAPQPVYPVSAPASAGSPASAGGAGAPGYPSPTAPGAAAQANMMNAYARREAELAAYANEARQFRMLQQQATQQHSFTTLQHAMVPRQQQQQLQQGQFPGQQASQMGSTSSAGIAYPPGQNPSAGGGSSAGFFNF
ncbi:hypothetical protein FRC01_003003 [Tulasnella sp. 417]|nr:hypothetical protein FRC01_003003 [Tulasnella sp. 417]